MNKKNIRVTSILMAVILTLSLGFWVNKAKIFAQPKYLQHRVNGTMGLCPYYGLQIYPNIFTEMNNCLLECNGAAGYYGLALWTELTHSDTNYPCLEDNYNKIYTMSDPNADYLGQVCYKVEAGVIKKADINFNMGYPFSISGDKNSYDLLSVLTHELGHVMGLDHDTNNTSAVMYKSIGTGEIKRKFTALEKQYLYNLYH